MDQPEIAPVARGRSPTRVWERSDARLCDRCCHRYRDDCGEPDAWRRRARCIQDTTNLPSCRTWRMFYVASVFSDLRVTRQYVGWIGKELPPTADVLSYMNLAKLGNLTRRCGGITVPFASSVAYVGRYRAVRRGHRRESIQSENGMLECHAMRIRHLALAILILIFSRQVGADGDVSSLREYFDPGLQEQLEDTLRDLGLATPVAKGKLAVALVNLTDLDEPQVASVNGDQMMYAASLPKIAILLGAFVAQESGKLELNAKNRESLVQMIRYSSNREATNMLNRVGRSNLIKILTSNRFRLYDPGVGGGLWVGKEYGKAKAYRRDPLNNLSHGATALQVARFYYLLERGELVAPRATAEMKRILSKPGIKHKFVKGLANAGPATIYRKSGTWKQWHADSMLVEATGHTYILVALAEDARGGGWLESLARATHRVIVPQPVAARY